MTTIKNTSPATLRRNVLDTEAIFERYPRISQRTFEEWRYMRIGSRYVRDDELNNWLWDLEEKWHAVAEEAHAARDFETSDAAFEITDALGCVRDNTVRYITL